MANVKHTRFSRMCRRRLLEIVVVSSALFILTAWTHTAANAALQPISSLGEVTVIDKESSLITIQTSYRWGWKSWISHYESLEGNTPVDAADELEVGDYVEAGSLGVPENYVALAKLVGASNRTVTDVYGDPRFLQTPLLGNYSISFTNVPDLPGCSGWICPAACSDVSITQLDATMVSHRLYPGQTFGFQAEACNITVTFHSGEAYNQDPMYDGWAGRQTTSDFTIHLTRENLPLENDAATPMLALGATTVVAIVVVAVVLVHFMRSRKGSTETG